MFLNDKTQIGNHEKITRILCCVSLNIRDIGKLLTFCEKQAAVQDRRRSINALKIVYGSQNKLTPRLQQKICEIASKILEKSTNMEERLLAIQLFVKIGDSGKEQKNGKS